MPSMFHAIIAVAVTLTLAIPSASVAKEIAPAGAFLDAPAQASDDARPGHDLHAAQRGQSPAPYALTGHDLHAAATGDRTVVNAAASPPDRADGGLNWSDAAIGAVGMLGILLGLTGLTLLAQHRQRRVRTP